MMFFDASNGGSVDRRNRLPTATSVTCLFPGIRHPLLFEHMPLSLDALWLMTVKVHLACGLSGKTTTSFDPRLEYVDAEITPPVVEVHAQRHL